MSYPIKFHPTQGGVLEAVGQWDVFENTTDTSPHTWFHIGETMYFEYTWKQKGWYFDPPPQNENWKLHIYFEKIGLGQTNTPPEDIATVAVTAGDPLTYPPVRYAVPTTGMAEGTYRVTAAIQLHGATKPRPFGGFTEGAMIYLFP